MFPSKVLYGLPMLLAAMAQEPSPGRLAATTFGPRFGSPIELLRMGQLRDEVRTDLAIALDQEKAIEEVLTPLNELRGDFLEAQSLAPEERRKRMQEIFKEGVARSKLAEEKLYQILKPQQTARLKQLWLRFQGAAVLVQPEIAKQLGLTDEQQAKMRAIAASVAPKPGAHQPEEMSREERVAYFDDLNARRDKALVDLVDVLTPEQKATFAAMKGPEPSFTFPPRRLGSSSDRRQTPKQAQ